MRWTRLTVLTIAMALLCLAYLDWRREKKRAPTDLVLMLDERQRDLGLQSPGQPLKTVFHARNTSSKPIRLIGVAEG